MEDKDTITLNEKSLEVLVAKFIPTSQYFERSFDSLQRQIDGLRLGQEELKRDMDRRFDQVYAQQTELKRDMDKRFEQVDKRFEQINHKLDTIIERLDVKIDAGLRENRAMSIRLFSFAMVFSAISMTALLAKMANLF
jgi:chromosome segregation ATPase